MGGLFLCAAFFAKGTVYRFNGYYGGSARRPFPTELLLEVREVAAMKAARPLVKTESFETPAYAKRLETVDARTGAAVTIEMSDADYDAAGAPKAGDTVAAFGLAKEKRTLFRLRKYRGVKDPASVEAWLAGLE